MKDVQFAIYEWTDASGKRRRSTYKMDSETAMERHPGATIVPSSIEVRRCPETDAEMTAQCWSTPRRLQPIRVLVCGSAATREQVCQALDMLAARRTVTVLIQTGEAEACLHADAWAFDRDIDRIASSPCYRTPGLRGASRAQHLIKTLHTEGVIAFPGGQFREAIIRLAIEHEVSVWTPFGVD